MTQEWYGLPLPEGKRGWGARCIWDDRRKSLDIPPDRKQFSEGLDMVSQKVIGRVVDRLLKKLRGELYEHLPEPLSDRVVTLKSGGVTMQVRRNSYLYVAAWLDAAPLAAQRAVAPDLPQVDEPPPPPASGRRRRTYEVVRGQPREL